MIISLTDININVHLYPFSGDDNFVFLLHGFTGSGKDWSAIVKELHPAFNYVTVDLPGHGLSEAPPEVSLYSPDALIGQMEELISHFTKNKIILIGYSMGGRAALLFSANRSNMVKGLVLEGATAGIKDDTARKIRAVDDDNLAGYIEKHTIEEFVDHWMNLDIFKSQKKMPKRLSELRAEKLNNNKSGLANSLRGFSTGKMPLLYSKLKDINFKTLLISGEMDNKYTLLNAEMARLIPYCQHLVIPGAGHNVHVEKKEEYISAVNKFLQSY